MSVAIPVQTPLSRTSTRPSIPDRFTGIVRPYSDADVQRYVYGKIYNAKAYNLCTQMPRFGASGTLTPQQIKDLVGLLLDPASPVNQ